MSGPWRCFRCGYVMQQANEPHACIDTMRGEQSPTAEEREIDRLRAEVRELRVALENERAVTDAQRAQLAHLQDIEDRHMETRAQLAQMDREFTDCRATVTEQCAAAAIEEREACAALLEGSAAHARGFFGVPGVVGNTARVAATTATELAAAIRARGGK